MKKNITILFVMLSFFSIAQVPQPALLSFNVYGGNGNDKFLNGTTPTADGGFILRLATHSTIGTGTIDSFCSIGGERNVYFKYNSDATVLEWTRCFSGGSGCIFPVSSGDFIFGGGKLLPSGWAFSVQKKDSNDNIIWGKTFGDSITALFRDAIAVDDGYIIVGVVYYIDTDFTTHYGGLMSADIGVLKVDSSGHKVWCKVIGGSGEEMVKAVVPAPGNGCYIVGTTPSNDYDCTGNHGGSSGSSDAYIARLDKNGNIIWHKNLGGSGYDRGNAGWPDGKGGIIVGATSHSNDGDVSHQINYGGLNIWAIALDSNGHIAWDNCYGGGGQEFTNSICRATDGSIWIAGAKGDKDSFQVDRHYGRLDAWFVHADSVGNFLNAKVMGSDRQDEGLMIYPLSSGNVVSGGYYENGNGTFMQAWGGVDAFLSIFASWSTGIESVSGAERSIQLYPNPANDFLVIKSEKNETCNVVISDLVGKVIYESELIDKLEIPVSVWSKGIYIVHLNFANGDKEVQKLIIQ